MGSITPRENIMKAYKHQIPEYLPSVYTDINLFKPCPEIERYCGGETGKDGFGVEWKYEAGSQAPMTTQNHLIDCITDWEKVTFPDLDSIDWKQQMEIDAHTDPLSIMQGKGVLPFEDGHSIFETHDKFNMALVINGPFERMHAIEGFDNALCDLLEEPEACADYFHAIAVWKARLFHLLAENYELDGINSHDDYGSAQNLFMSLALWRKLIKPNLALMVEQCHKDGLLYQHHSCGYIEPLIEDFIEIGVDAIDTWQGGSNPNVGELKKKYGSSITFCGGFDNQYVIEQPNVTEEEIRAEYRRTVDLLAPGGSYVVFPIGISRKNMPVFLDEHWKYGLEFYKSH